MNLTVFTAAYDGQHTQLDLLRESCTLLGVELHRYGSGGYPGWKQAKVDDGIKFLDALPGTVDLAMWVDGFDSLLLHGTQEIVARYNALPGGPKKVVVATEHACWPDSHRAEEFIPVVSGNRFPNAGGYIGPPALLAETLSIVRSYTPGENDQSGWIGAILSGDVPWVVMDRTSRLYQSMNSPKPKEPACVLHWNGKVPGREEFWKSVK